MFVGIVGEDGLRSKMFTSQPRRIHQSAVMFDTIQPKSPRKPAKIAAQGWMVPR